MHKIIAFAMSFALASAFADEVTYTGRGTSFSDPDSWSAAPQVGDTAVIPEGVTAEVLTADKTFLKAFAACRIEEGATLFLNAITFKWSDSHPDDPNYCDTFGLNLLGSGCLRAEGGKTCLTGDNREFSGTFVTTNNALYACKPYSFGTSNDIYCYSQAGGTWETEEVRIQRVNGPSVVSNNLHLTVDTGRRSAFYNGKNPLHFYGDIEINAEAANSGGMLSVGAPAAYDIYFHGKQTGNSFLIFSSGATDYVNYHFEPETEIDMEGGLFTFGANVELKGKITRAILDSGRGDYGYLFSAQEVSSTNCTWFFNRTKSYESGGQFDLNGYDQHVGDIGIMPSTRPSFPGCVIKSDEKATLTCCGSMGRDHPDIYNCFNGVLKGKVSFCYDYDGRPAFLCGSRLNPAGKFIFSGTSSDTTGGLSCRRGELTIAETAGFPNITELKAFNTGVIKVAAAGLGAAGEGLCVQALDTATIDLAEGLTLAADVACVRGQWLDAGTYGSAEAVAAAGVGTAVEGLTGLGLMTVERYGGKPGLILLVR